LLQAIEAESMFDIREKSEALLIGAADLNRALLAALKAARDLQP